MGGAVPAGVTELVNGGLKMMMLAKLKVVAAVAVVCAGLGTGGLAASRGWMGTSPEKVSPAAPVSGDKDWLSWKDFETLPAVVKPQPDEWKFMQIPWTTDLNAARKKAAKEGKPLYVWTMAGVPLGHA